MILHSPIAISLSPNTQTDDIWQAMKILVQIWKWKQGKELSLAEDWFKEYFNVTEVSLFNSGRSALYAVLASFGIGDGDEVIIQAFTCVAVPDPIIWTGARPVYVDIDETLNMDPKLLDKCITDKTRVIIVQHTFGVPAKIELIKKIAQKHNLILIEDCAHALGAEIKGKKVGTFGDAAIFSFGRDKVISSVFGGMAIISSQPKAGRPLAERLKELQKSLPYPSYFWIFQQILHPIAFSLILPLYKIYIGKLILFILQKLHLLSKPIYKEEISGGKPDIFPKLYPNALAFILLKQLEKLDEYNQKRRKIAQFYSQKLSKIQNITLPPKITDAIYLRFNIQTAKAEKILSKAKRQGILLGNWYRNIIDPRDVDYGKIGYNLDSCPKAEAAAKLSLNLPTHPKLIDTDLEKIVNLFH